MKPAKERKVVFLRKRWLAIPGALRICALCLVTTLPPTSPPPPQSGSSHLLSSGTTRPAPLFDAAWGNEDTQTLIDIFDKYNVKVTFFVVGEWVDKYPESVKALADAGHEVMGHSNDHAHFNTLSADQIVEDINTCNDKIEKITGKRPTLFRPPFGEYDDHVITTVRGMGIEPIQWDVDSLDWKDYDAATITQRVTSSVGPGSIVLFHNAALHTPEALPDILEYLLGEGYEIVPISQLILDGEYGTDYTIDHTGRQCPVSS
ncbi:MAG: polysaccharide deacetylase family protein [Evtepia gabavorous]